MNTKKLPKPKSTPKTRLSAQLICQQAVLIADAEGIDALSMRKLASHLGCEAMSIYNHLKNKDEILDGMVEFIAADFHVPDLSGNWKQEMHRRAHRAHSVLMAHPWATQMMVSRVNIGPNVLTYVDATIGCLTRAGFDYATADHAWNTLDGFVYGFTLQQLNFPFEPEAFSEAAQENMPLLPPENLPHLRGLAMMVAGGEHDGIQTLDFGLDIILDGLAAKLSR